MSTPGRPTGPRPPLVRPGDAVAVLGLGVSGVAAARLAAARGASVYASDVALTELQSAAAEELRAEGIDAEVGRHDLERIRGCDLLVVSPGIPPSAEVRRELRDAGIPSVAEVELAYRDLTSRLIGVTGTNGKTTATALCHQVLLAGGIDAAAAGNIGVPLCEIALRTTQPDWVVVELSSFQLADVNAFSVEIGVLLNLSPDHLDRYRDLASYYADKKRLFRNATAESCWVLNADDPAVLELARGAPGTHYHVSTVGPVRPGAYLDDDALTLEAPDRCERWLTVGEMRLPGRHNIGNALAAGLAASLAGCDGESIGRALAEFEGLPHRLEPVGTYDGVLWVNDSKATNVAATLVAVQAFDRPLVLILGGRHKGEPFAPLLPWLDRTSGIVAFGEAAPQVVAELNGSLSGVQVESSLESAVRSARELATPGGVILFSPACSSYDMFRNYEERGKAFRRAVDGLHARVGGLQTGGEDG
ncbi:MAG: UDP-N-acetylmuramoyl-L-alanine--D-glutamate ligase [Gemmatimonadota bacterium]